MKVSDYIIDFLVSKGIDTVFMVTGGHAMFLNDSVYRNKKLKPIFVHHEQAAGMAAEAYGRIKGIPGFALVTAGPGAINVLNGVVGAYVDSAPMFVISGQSSSSNVVYMEKTGIRQYGLQGIYIKPIASAITKFFTTVDDASMIAFYLEKAYDLATYGRPGPVWLEVPLDVQRMEVPKTLLQHYEQGKYSFISKSFTEDVKKTLSTLYKSKRPVFLLGQGVRLAASEKVVHSLLRKTRIPVITTRLGIDLIDSDDSLFVGRPGLYGDRPANIAVQKADFILALGARLDPGIIGYDASDWGRNAKKVIIDIDSVELAKPGLTNATRIQVDAKRFTEELEKHLDSRKLPDTKKWLATIAKWKQKYPTVDSLYKKDNPVNSYFFSERLSELSSKNDTVLVDTSSPFHVVCQAWKIKKGQRFLTTGGISTMGYWPAAIGACMANRLHNTIIITGDGCLQMNIQELATVRGNRLPIKIFVINNNGYLLIRHTQKTHMEGRLLGESPKTGLWIPDLKNIAKAYELRFVRITRSSGIDAKIREVLTYKGPVLVDVLSPQWQPILPRIASDKRPDGSLVSRPYEDMFPYLDREEFRRIMEE